MVDGRLLKVYPNPKQFMLLTLILVILLICYTALAEHEEKPTFTKSNCVIEVIYDEKMENEVSRRMVCADGVIGPTYWQLFANFYYDGVSVPEYCRYVKSENAFSLPDKVCLNDDGTWRYDD
jgi:hypothetical protein